MVFETSVPPNWFETDHGREQPSVSMIKSLWASVQGDPAFMRRVNGWFTIFWIAMIPVSIAFGLLSSVSYVSALSLWALVSGHWSAWQAARVEVQQQADAKALEDNPIEQRVVEKVVRETEVNRVEGASTDGSFDTSPNSTSQGCAASNGSHISGDFAIQLAVISEQLAALRAQVERPSQLR